MPKVQSYNNTWYYRQHVADPEESKDVVLPAASSCTQMQLAE